VSHEQCIRPIHVTSFILFDPDMTFRTDFSLFSPNNICISCKKIFISEYINHTWSFLTGLDYKMLVGFSCRFWNGVCCSCVTFRTTHTVDCAVTKLCIDPFTYVGVKYLITTFTMVRVETRDSVFTICLNHVLRSWPIQMWPSHNWERIESGSGYSFRLLKTVFTFWNCAKLQKLQRKKHLLLRESLPACWQRFNVRA